MRGLKDSYHAEEVADVSQLLLSCGETEDKPQKQDLL